MIRVERFRRQGWICICAVSVEYPTYVIVPVAVLMLVGKRLYDCHLPGKKLPPLEEMCPAVYGT